MLRSAPVRPSGFPRPEAVYRSGVRLTVFLLLAVLAAVVQHSLLAIWWWAPDLPLALAAWAMVDGDEDGVVLRALLLGLVRDLVDPGSEWFHTAAYAGLAFAFLPVRGYLFRTRGLAWALWAAVCSLLLALIDWISAGFSASDPVAVAGMTVGTALAAMPIGWLFGGLPRLLRPVGVGGA